MIRPFTVECDFQVVRHAHGRKVLGTGQAKQPNTPTARIPRVSRLMALAIHFEGLLRAGKLKDYANIARLGHVSRARVTQIMNLLMLAPDIQEEILFLPPFSRGREQILLRDLQPVAAEPIWSRQRKLWRSISMCEDRTP
jgi:hypothetical protein